MGGGVSVAGLPACRDDSLSAFHIGVICGQPLLLSRNPEKTFCVAPDLALGQGPVTVSLDSAGW
jgi:hypothetical protein